MWEGTVRGIAERKRTGRKENRMYARREGRRKAAMVGKEKEGNACKKMLRKGG